MDMSWIETSLTRLEARLRELIEGDTATDGIPRKFHKQLLHDLTLAMRSKAKKVPKEHDLDRTTLTAPDQYTLVLPTEQAQILLTHPTELDRLAHNLESIAAQSGIMFAVPPMLCVVADPLVKELRILVEDSHAGTGDSYTTEVEGMLDNPSQASAGWIPQAFLIVNGLTTFLLTEPVINIGRDPSNQLHLEDARVSRMHAQLRLIQGRFVIFDLDSMGGTIVNGVAVSSHALTPGDVILLAGVPLVYGQEATPQAGYTQELPVDPPAPEVL
jgi:FHA domain